MALLLMTELGENYSTRRVSLSHIAKKHHLSYLFLKKIARALRLSGLVSGKVGMDGGYCLSRAPRTISVWDIVEACSGKPHVESLNDLVSECPVNTNCLPQKIRRTIGSTFEQSMRNVRLSDLMRKGAQT